MTESIGTTIGSTSSSLLSRVKARDEEAWQRLVRLYGPLTNFWIRRAGLQAADAGDVFQEVFRAVAEAIGDFCKDHSTGSFRGWLRTITRSKLADHFRRAEHQPMATGGSAAYHRLQQAEGPVEEADDPREADTVRQLRLRAMELIQGEFEPRTWEMFWRVTAEDQAAKDVAADLGVSSAAVRLAKSRVLRRLREELEGLEEL